MHMNYSQIMSPRPPLPRKVEGHDPQLLWERRPCMRKKYIPHMVRPSPSHGLQRTKLQASREK